MASVAPYHACIVCYQGDTTTGVVLKGEAEFVLGFMQAKLGMDPDEAYATMRVVQEERGNPLEPGKVPSGDMIEAFRLCHNCGDQAGLEVVTLDGDSTHIQAYIQPPELRDPEYSQDIGMADVMPLVIEEIPQAPPDGEARWMIQLFESLHPDKTWIIPRSNSVLQRDGNDLLFLDGTHDEYMACKYNFAKVGITVRWGRG